MSRQIFLIVKKSHLVLFLISLLFIGGVSLFFITVSSRSVAQTQNEITIFIDIPEKKLYVMKNGEIIKKFPIASGTYETPSPLGDWRIVNKSTWGEGFGGRWMGLNVPWGKYGIHGTTKPSSIGGATSHGCIRMLSQHAKELYRMVPINTKVKIYGGPYGPFGMGFRTLHPGDRGSDVYEVQVRLKRLGFFKAEPNGIYGEQTKKAVFDFQKKHKLPVSNYIDKKFYEKLNIILIE